MKSYQKCCNCTFIPLDPNPCISSPCLHNSACIDESNSKEKGVLMVDRNDYKCFCSQGYRGKVCNGKTVSVKNNYCLVIYEIKQGTLWLSNNCYE